MISPEETGNSLQRRMQAAKVSSTTDIDLLQLVFAAFDDFEECNK